MADIKYFDQLSPVTVIDPAKIMALQSDPRIIGGGYKLTITQLKNYILASAPTPQYEPFTASAGQTVFTILGPIPSSPGTSKLAVNGQLREYGATKDYTIAANTITWYNNDYTMQAGDLVQIWYDDAAIAGAPISSVLVNSSILKIKKNKLYKQFYNYNIKNAKNAYLWRIKRERRK